MNIIITLLLLLSAVRGGAEDVRVHVFLDADNTLCDLNTLEMNTNLMRVLSFFDLKVADMLTRTGYQNAPGTKTCFRQIIIRELERIVPTVKFGSIYTPHDAAMAKLVPEWPMGQMYEQHMLPIELEFLKLLETKEFLFPHLSEQEAIARRSELYRKHRRHEPPLGWTQEAQTHHRVLNSLLFANENFYISNLADWDNATKGQTITHVMKKVLGDEPDERHFVIFIDDAVRERDEVSLALKELNLAHLAIAPPHMRGVFMNSGIYIPIGMLVYQLAIKLERLPNFSKDDFDAVLDMAEQDLAQKNYEAAMFLLGLLYRALPDFSERLTSVMLEVLAQDPDALKIFLESDFKKIDVGPDVEDSSVMKWEDLNNYFKEQLPMEQTSEAIVPEPESLEPQLTQAQRSPRKAEKSLLEPETLKKRSKVKRLFGWMWH